MEDNKKKQTIIISSVVLVVLVTTIFITSIILKNNKLDEVITINNKPLSFSEYKMTGNDLQNFDLAFLKLENDKVNKIYSPLSIKYALAMLNEGAAGQTKEQITSVIGDYVSNKYNNSANMSFANALFVKDTYKGFIKPDYINNLKSKYNAEVIYDSFQNATTINNWIKEKTLNLIPNILNGDELNDLDYALVNALAIDMEWINKIQKENDDWQVAYDHESDTEMYIDELSFIGYKPIKFEGKQEDAKTVEIGASINKYDIVNTLGEENIRKTVGEDYQKWLDDGACGDPDNEPDVNTFLNKYISELNANYKQISSSTDFYYYDDRDIKGFAKDLKTYDNTTLQYIGIMPKSGDLAGFVDNMTVDSMNKLINDLKPIELSSFDEGYITQITGYIPMFSFDYTLKLKEDLKKLGITDVFETEKSNLSNLTTQESYIDKLVHKANIEFSNDGIKASAVTIEGGKGATGCWYDYDYNVPIKRIDLTFDKPYLFIIRDKKTGEVWFTGTVYNPTTHTSEDINEEY